MKNDSSFKNISCLCGKVLMVFLFVVVLNAVSNAQTSNLYYQSNGAFYGKLTIYSGSHFLINTRDGNEIKTYANSCKTVSVNGVAGLYCTFGQFREGRLYYSGDAYFFKNGYVYLRWLYEFTGNQQRSINTGWYAFR